MSPVMVGPLVALAALLVVPGRLPAQRPDAAGASQVVQAPWAVQAPQAVPAPPASAPSPIRKTATGSIAAASARVVAGVIARGVPHVP